MFSVLKEQPRRTHSAVRRISDAILFWLVSSLRALHDRRFDRELPVQEFIIDAVATIATILFDYFIDGAKS